MIMTYSATAVFPSCRMKSPVFSVGMGVGGSAHRFASLLLSPGDILVSWASGDGNTLGLKTEVKLPTLWLLVVITS